MKKLYRWRRQEKKKDRKTRKSRKEEKVVGFSSACFFHRKETGGSHQGGKREVIDYSTRRITQGGGNLKGWETKKDYDLIPNRFKYD